MGEHGPFIRTELPNGAAVFYRDSDHSYWREVKQKRDGWSGTGRLTGVSTVVSPLDFRPDNLMRWAAKTNGHGIAQLAAPCLALDSADSIRRALQWLQNGDAIWQALAREQLLYDQARDQAATRGTNVHKHGLHALATGRPVPDRARLSDEEWGFVQGIVAFWFEHDPRPLQAEQTVADLDLGVAGTFDLRCEIRAGHARGEVWMLDAKTSGFMPLKHHAQVVGYDDLAEGAGFGGSDRCVILQVDAQGGYDLIEAQASRDQFRRAVQLYRDVGDLGRAARNGGSLLQRLRAEGLEAAA